MSEPTPYGAFVASTLVCALGLFGLTNLTAAQGLGEEERRARQLSSEGERAYAEGHFDEAALLFRRAHEVFPEPLLLHNLGRALESAGDDEDAVEAYRRYLEARPDADNRAHVEARLVSLRAEIEEDAAPTPAVEPTGSAGLSSGPFLFGGLGLATGAAAVVTGVLALEREAEARAEPVQDRARQILDEGETLALGTNILLVAGSALFTIGVVWLAVELANDGDDAPVQVGLGFGSITIEGEFAGL